MANRKRNVAYVSQDEPAFLRQFKQRVGYKEAPDVNAKFQTPDFDDSDEDRPEADDEKPQVVVLRKGDLTEAEADALDKGQGPGASAEDEVGGKIVFKKPVKRQGESSGDLNVSSKKAKDSDSQSDKSKKSDELKKKLKDKNKKIKNTKLLSFDAEEEEED